MALNSICASCLRTLRHQTRREITSLPRTTILASKPFATSTVSRKESSLSRSQPPPPPLARPAPGDTAIHDIAARLRSAEILRSTTEPLVAYGATENLFLECRKQCDYTIPAVLTSPPGEVPKTAAGEELGEGTGWWFEPKAQGGLGLDPTFYSWAQVMFLHMYALTARFRAFPAAHVTTWHQNLLDHFFYAAEDRMTVWHGMTSRGVRNRYLKDLNAQWRGVLVSYDEGVIKNDAVLATAVWRNIFNADAQVDVLDLALVTAHLRSQMSKLDGMTDEVVAGARVTFDSPVNALASIGVEAKSRSARFEPEELSASSVSS